jgi:hypothetical protein
VQRGWVCFQTSGTEINKDEEFDVLSHGQFVDELPSDIELDFTNLPRQFDALFEKTEASHMRGTIINLGETWTQEQTVSALGIFYS